MKIKVTVSSTVLKFYDVEIPDETPADDIAEVATEALYSDSEAEPYREDSVNWEVIDAEIRA